MHNYRCAYSLLHAAGQHPPVMYCLIQKFDFPFYHPAQALDYILVGETGLTQDVQEEFDRCCTAMDLLRAGEEEDEEWSSSSEEETEDCGEDTENATADISVEDKEHV